MDDASIVSGNIPIPGLASPHGNCMTNTANNYCGEQWAPDLGIYYLRARYLNPNTGRFWSMDSYGGSKNDPRSLHKYLYWHSNPVDLKDPTGHWWTIGTKIHQSAIDEELSFYLKVTATSSRKPK